MLYQLRMYAWVYATGTIIMPRLVLGRLLQMNLFGLHYYVFCRVMETKQHTLHLFKGYAIPEQVNKCVVIQRRLNSFLSEFFIDYLMSGIFSKSSLFSKSELSVLKLNISVIWAVRVNSLSVHLHLTTTQTIGINPSYPLDIIYLSHSV